MVLVKLRLTENKAWLYAKTQRNFLSNSFLKIATEAATKEINYNGRNAQNGKSVKLNKEEQKIKIGKHVVHNFYKILNTYLYIF